MPRPLETVTVGFFGLLAMGSIDKVASGLKDAGTYGTTTSGAVELFFFLIVFSVIVLVFQNYLSK